MKRDLESFRKRRMGVVNSNGNHAGTHLFLDNSAATYITQIKIAHSYKGRNGHL